MPKPKIIFFLFYIGVFPFFAKAQTNLVQNPSFETYTTCPNNQGQVQLANSWDQWGSADYFNSCSTFTNFSVPKNWGGYQVPTTGNAYCGLVPFQSKTGGAGNVREYIYTQLLNSLNIGTKYFVSYRVAATISTIIFSNCALKSMDALFTTNKFIYANPISKNYPAQIKNSTFINDTMNWTQVFNSFTSDSSYNYITIGNFFMDINTDTLILDGGNYCNTYYYIDDVCVSTDSIFTKNYFTNMNEEKSNDFSNNIYPNPANNFIYFKSNLKDDLKFYLYNEIGLKTTGRLENSSIDLTNLPSGMYFLKIENSEKQNVITTKIIKQ